MFHEHSENYVLSQHTRMRRGFLWNGMIGKWRPHSEGNEIHSPIHGGFLTARLRLFSRQRWERVIETVEQLTNFNWTLPSHGSSGIFKKNRLRLLKILISHLVLSENFIRHWDGWPSFRQQGHIYTTKLGANLPFSCRLVGRVLN